MGFADLLEWLGLLAAAPIAVVMYGFWLITMLYAYLDGVERSRSKIFAVLLALSIGLAYWPVSFLAYLVVASLLDRRPLQRSLS